MKKTEIEDKIKTAFLHSVPDVLDSILSNCEEQEGNVINMNNEYDINSNEKNDKVRRDMMKGIASVAAIFFLLISAFAGYNIYGLNAVDSIISFDVNPSIEMKVNKKEKVIEMKPLNKEGQLVIGKMDFKNTDLDIAVNALIGSMLKNGYISNISNSILISVENKNEEKGVFLQERLSQEISELLHASSIEGAVLSQMVSEDDQTTSLAKENDVTKGKAQLISQLIKVNPNYKSKDFAKLSINELNLLIESNNLKLSNASSIGRASEEAYIGREQAIKIAIEHAAVNPEELKDLEAKLDFDDGKFIYEIEFDTNGVEYEYDIDATTSEVLEFKKDVDNSYYEDIDDDNDNDDDEEEDDDDDRDEDKKVSTLNTNTTFDNNKESVSVKTDLGETVQNSTSLMAAAEARKVVIQRFGGIIQKIEYTYDESNPMYKGEALKGGEKLVFELNARTKSFDKWDIGNDNSWDTFSNALANLIAMDQAANIVINKSGKSDTFVQKIDFLWDDSEPLYQGEAFNKGVKYSFEIYAYGGEFQKWDISSGDDTWAEKYFNVK